LPCNWTRLRQFMHANSYAGHVPGFDFAGTVVQTETIASTPINCGTCRLWRPKTRKHQWSKILCKPRHCRWWVCGRTDDDDSNNCDTVTITTKIDFNSRCQWKNRSYCIASSSLFISIAVKRTKKRPHHHRLPLIITLLPCLLDAVPILVEAWERRTLLITMQPWLRVHQEISSIMTRTLPWRTNVS